MNGNLLLYIEEYIHKKKVKIIFTNIIFLFLDINNFFLISVYQIEHELRDENIVMFYVIAH